MRTAVLMLAAAAAVARDLPLLELKCNQQNNLE